MIDKTQSDDIKRIICNSTQVFMSRKLMSECRLQWKEKSPSADVTKRKMSERTDIHTFPQLTGCKTLLKDKKKVEFVLESM